MENVHEAAEHASNAPASIATLKAELMLEFRKELRSQLAAHRAEIGKEKRSFLSKSYNKMVDEVWSSGDGTKHANRNVAGNAKPPLKIPAKLDYAAGKDRASIPLLKWACVVTIASFAQGVTSVRGWIPDNISNGLAMHGDTIAGASGLSILLFSFKSSGGRARIRCPVGRLWTFFMRRAVVTALIRARTIYFENGDENATELENGTREARKARVTAPSWIVGLGDKQELDKAVNEVFELMERSQGTSSASSADSESGISRKRRRTTDSPEVALDEGAIAIKEIRRQWMEKMNHARTEVRSYLYLKVMFIFENEERFRASAEMRAAGNNLTFNDDGAGADLHMDDLDLWKGTAWDIPSAKTYELQGGGLKDKERVEADAWNKRELLHLERSFPSLNAVISYFKRVELPPDAVERETGESSDGVIWWPVSESTVHVIAIGLRGLIKKCQAKELSETEKCATGAVSNDDVRSGDEVVTIRMEGKRRGKGLSRLENNRKMKFEMAYEDYVRERDAKAEKERMSTTSSHSETLQTSPHTVDIDEFL